jgi:hypothetical protein
MSTTGRWAGYGWGTGMDMGFWEEKGSIDTAPFRVILYLLS